MKKSNIFAMTHQHKADVRSVCVGLTCKADIKLIGSLLKTEADSLVFLAVEVFPANCEVRFSRLQFFRDRLHPPCTCGANSTMRVECGHMSVNNLHRERMSHIRGVPKNGLSLRNLFNLTNFFSKWSHVSISCIDSNKNLLFYAFTFSDTLNAFTSFSTKGISCFECALSQPNNAFPTFLTISSDTGGRRDPLALHLSNLPMSIFCRISKYVLLVVRFHAILLQMPVAFFECVRSHSNTQNAFSIEAMPFLYLKR